MRAEKKPPESTFWFLSLKKLGKSHSKTWLKYDLNRWYYTKISIRITLWITRFQFWRLDLDKPPSWYCLYSQWNKDYSHSNTFPHFSVSVSRFQCPSLPICTWVHSGRDGILVCYQATQAKLLMFIKAENQNSGTTSHSERFSSMPPGSTMCPFQNSEFNTSGMLQDIGQGTEEKENTANSQ